MTDTLFILRYYRRRYTNNHPLIVNFKSGNINSYDNAIYTMALEAHSVFENVYTNTFLIKVARKYMEEKRGEFNTLL